MKTKTLSDNVHLETYTPRIIALSLLLVVLLLALTGCKQETRSAADLDPAGEYTLISVDGNSLPCSLTHAGTSSTIKSGSLTLNPDGSCRSLITFSVPRAGEVRREVKATCERQQAELTMHWDGAGVTMGHINGNQFTMTNEGMVFGYQK
jgi:hypothetical protein